ncbi:hypothetical protein KP509_37G043800 [Ceratopteris richardii]|nr:hypothetical protein KP509_37G043800 [Ceratopteris richardii]
MVNDVAYTKPGRWRVFLRKIRAETKRMNCSRPSPQGFHYDALSYAMNFDDGICQHQHHLQHSPCRFSRTGFIEPLPPCRRSVSASAS